MLNDVPQNGLAVELEVTTPPEVVVRFHRAEVLPQLDPKNPSVEALLYVFNTRGDAVASRGKRISFLNSDAADGDITLPQRFDLPPGTYVAKALLLIEGTTSLGFARKEFTVSP